MSKAAMDATASFSPHAASAVSAASTSRPRARASRGRFVPASGRPLQQPPPSAAAAAVRRSSHPPQQPASATAPAASFRSRRRRLPQPPPPSATAAAACFFLFRCLDGSRWFRRVAPQTSRPSLPSLGSTPVRLQTALGTGTTGPSGLVAGWFTVLLNRRTGRGKQPARSSIDPQHPLVQWLGLYFCM